MASSWSPDTKNQSAQWSMETSSCDDWIALSNGTWHLLEKFVRQVTQSDLHLHPKKVKKVQPSDQIKARLIAALNSQVKQYLKAPYSHLDCHPKTSNSHLALEKRVFQGAIKLMVVRSAQSQMTDTLLSNELQKMTLATHKLWLADIEAGHYKVIQQPDISDEEKDTKDSEWVTMTQPFESQLANDFTSA
ncbi:hypothetical protein DFH28DRAFT_893125 [Melampsora americana]|nr:hypothetical protein DFH28DRAFT_893125 [Melampsora americana]